MEVPLTVEIQTKLNQLAATRATEPETLAREVIERALNYEEWFIREVEKGIAAADLGEFLTHEEVGAQMEKRLAQRSSLLMKPRL